MSITTRTTKIHTSRVTCSDGVRHRQDEEGDEGDAGHPVGLEAVGRGPHRVPGVVAGAVGDDAGVAGVVLLDVEGDLHQVGADVSDLGEDPAGDPQAGRSQGLSDREPDEAGAGDVAGQHQHDEQHHEQLDRDEHHADAHPRAHRDVEALVGPAAQRGVGGPRVGEGVDPDAVPGDAEGAGHPDQAEQQDDEHLRAHVLEEQEVDQDHRGDERPQHHEEPGLLLEVGLAGLVDGLRDLLHGAVHGQPVQCRVAQQAEQQAQDAYSQADPQQAGAGDPADPLVSGGSTILASPPALA
jgi:hypothetical protein